jgi:hypothetical protein
VNAAETYAALRAELEAMRTELRETDPDGASDMWERLDKLDIAITKSERHFHPEVAR